MVRGHRICSFEGMLKKVIDKKVDCFFCVYKNFICVSVEMCYNQYRTVYLL